MSVDRASRVAEAILGILAETVRRDVRDPRVGFVTLTSVRLSSDLRHATVFVSSLGGDASLAESLRALDRAAPFLKRAIANRAGLRFVPELRFAEDVSLARGSRVEELLVDIDRERRRTGADDGDDGDEGDEGER